MLVAPRLLAEEDARLLAACCARWNGQLRCAAAHGELGRWCPRWRNEWGLLAMEALDVAALLAVLVDALVRILKSAKPQRSSPTNGGK
ncbi:MAG: hypothetical protein U1F49_06840 [Rubrivivax sp.]